MASNDVVTVVDPESLPRGEITRVDEIFFETRDGCRLSARLWLPDGVSPDDASSRRAPAVIEILPYGVHHGTIDTDEATWPYLAGNGIACVRVDARGSGNSRGVLDDEYSPTQQRDACDAVEWVASRSWCTGAVGLMGCSWGGFVALQVAALRGKTKRREAPSLRAVCAVCATDERASDDMHWMGGSLLGENLAWGAWLLDACAAPPVPVSDERGIASDKNTCTRVLSDKNNDDDATDREEEDHQSAWESRWVDRLDALKPMHGEWASIHPSTDAGDAYWSTGSVGGANTRDIDVPVLSVGCLNGGGYANATPRVARALGREKVTAIMGSWTHNYPHLSRSGPAFGFLAETLAFWRRNLGGAQHDDGWLPGDDGEGGGDALDEMNDAIPGVRIHVQRPPLVGGPVTAPTRAEGYWIAEASQRDLDAAAADGAIEASFTAEKTLALVAKPEDGRFKARLTDSPSDPVGAASGRWFTFGDGDDLPGDQTPDDEKSLCFDGDPVVAETALVGTPRVRVTCVRVVEDGDGGDDADADAAPPPPPPSGVVVARLCAVSPDDGSSHRISYGVVNVAAAHGRSVVKTAADGAFTVDVECAYCAFSLPVGWKLRVAVSQTYWPVVAASPNGFHPVAVLGGGVVVPALSQAHVEEMYGDGAKYEALLRASIPELEVLVAPRATRRLSSGNVRNSYDGEHAVAVRRVDSGAMMINPTNSAPSRTSSPKPFVVQETSSDVSAKKSVLVDGVGTQRVERRRVIRGLDVGGGGGGFDSSAPNSPKRVPTPSLVDAEIAVTADMTVMDGVYRFDTELEAFVVDGGEGGESDGDDPRAASRRSVFKKRWIETMPAVGFDPATGGANGINNSAA